jgi:hypothetical protein
MNSPDQNAERVFGRPNASPYVKDGIENAVLHGRRDAVNPAQTGTKMAALILSRARLRAAEVLEEGYQAAAFRVNTPRTAAGAGT